MVRILDGSVSVGEGHIRYGEMVCSECVDTCGYVSVGAWGLRGAQGVARGRRGSGSCFYGEMPLRVHKPSVGPIVIT